MMPPERSWGERASDQQIAFADRRWRIHALHHLRDGESRSIQLRQLHRGHRLLLILKHHGRSLRRPGRSLERQHDEAEFLVHLEHFHLAT